MSERWNRALVSILPARLADLNAGRLPTTSLMEVIAVDQPALLAAIFPSLADRAGGSLHSRRLLERMTGGAAILWHEFGDQLWVDAPTWNSDIARGWAAMAVGYAPGLTLSHRLKLATTFADDPHWAVREWAWLGVRDHIVQQPVNAVGFLTATSKHRSPSIRRFASEATRPIGVWSKHIAALKRDPSPALPLLENLWSDPSRYVRLSVGNWLNDASKSQPEWVEWICASLPPTEESDYVRRRALRTLHRDRR
jgi:3-methyladenine DNA glycosylase AlkC